MEKVEYQTELCDLPDNCIDEILKRVKTRVDRNDARLVCKLWQYFIDSDSSSECYLINRKTTSHKSYSRQPGFSELIPEFLNFNRNKISFKFQNINLRNTEHFWTEKGAHIIGLDFKNYWRQKIPLEHVLSKCIRLREMYIYYPTNKIINTLESLATKEIYNYSLNYLTINRSSSADISLEMAIRLLGLISKVFPRMRKVTFYRLEDINGQYEELSKKFIQLKYELELNTYNCRVVFGLSSKTPISVRSVDTDNWTLLPHKYFKDLEAITFVDGSCTFHLSRMENIFSQYPKLQILSISACTFICDLREPIRNRIKYLDLQNYGDKTFTISTVFFETFQFLKIFHMGKASDTTFADIILNMPYLEELDINYWIIERNEGKINEQQVLINENLKKLGIPKYFFSFQNGTIYRFNNLMKITVIPKPIFVSGLELQNVDELLQRFQCPNLKYIRFDVYVKTTKSIDSIWLENVMSMFPKLEGFTFRLYGSGNLITEDQKLGLRQICPKLNISDQHVSEILVYRDLRL